MRRLFLFTICSALVFTALSEARTGHPVPGDQQPAPTAAADAQAAAPAAGSDEDPPRVVTTVTVTAPAAPRRVEPSADVRTLPSSASVLRAPDIQNAPYREPGEVVRTMPGMAFTYYGQGGIPSGPTVRGYTDRNFGQDIAGFVDGIPLNLPGFVASHGALDLTTLVPETFERVELVRGPVEARFGDFNRGATLNFVTRDGVANPLVSLAGGQYGTWNVTGVAGNYAPGARRPSFYTQAGTQGTGGYADNQDLWHNRLFNRVIVPMPVGDLTFTAQNGWSEWDAPGYLDRAAVESGAVGRQSAVNPTDGGRLQHNLYALRYRAGAASSRPFEATFHVGARDFLRFRHDVLLGPTQPQVRQTDDRVTWGYRVEQTWGHVLRGMPLLFTAGTSLQRADAETRQARTLNREFVAWNDDVDELMTDAAVYAQGQIAPIGWLKAVGAMRYSWIDYEIQDNLRQPGQFVPEYSTSKGSPKVGVVVAPSRAIEIYGHFATGMRTPTPRTEVRNSTASIASVSVAETRNYELGATVRPMSRIDVDLNLWRADNANEIRGIPPGGVQFESLGKSRRNGGSVDVQWFVGPSARVTGGIAFVEARLLTPTNPAANHLPDVPDSVHHIGAQAPLGPQGTAAGRFSAIFDLYFYGRKDLNARLDQERYLPERDVPADLRRAVPLPRLGRRVLLSRFPSRRIGIPVRVARGGAAGPAAERRGRSQRDILTAAARPRTVRGQVLASCARLQPTAG